MISKMFTSSHRAIDVTNTLLFGAFATGHSVTLWDVAERVLVTGLISKIEIESGYSEGKPPTMFLVTLHVMESFNKTVCGKPHTVFVRTLS